MLEDQHQITHLLTERFVIRLQRVEHFALELGVNRVEDIRRGFCTVDVTGNGFGRRPNVMF